MDTQRRPGSETLTARQRQVIEFISECIERRGYPPTLREIGEQLGIRSTNGVNDHLKALERKGYLQREGLKSRTLRPTEHHHQLAVVPLVGQVAAGQPALAVENVEDTIKVDRSLVGASDKMFALRVKGDSMIEDGIFEGDYVFVESRASAKAGDTVVALIDDEATVKRYYPERDGVRLEPANAELEPIYVRAGEGRELTILGVVVGVYRRL